MTAQVRTSVRVFVLGIHAVPTTTDIPGTGDATPAEPVAPAVRGPAIR
ncbi:hypothetical protein [Mycobacterium sp. IS-1496]|nr:hypothetical protein [Mycobacterium sp. IS-1496]